MITKALYGMMVASHAVGTIIVKGAKFLASKTPKGVKKFGKKAKKVIKTEYKEQKAYIKTNPKWLLDLLQLVLGAWSWYQCI
jgi:hypothetical protein